MPGIPEYVSRFHLDADLMDELRQRVRVRLLTGDRPRIGEYRGQGPLQAWLRTCTIRVALNMRELALPSRVQSDDDPWLLLAGLDPALDRLLDVQRHRATLEEALRAALAALETGDKTLLRMHLIDSLGIDDLATVFRVHRATVARRLVALRRKVLDRLQNALAVDLGARPSEVKSLVRLLRSEIQVSVYRALGSAPEPRVAGAAR